MGKFSLTNLIMCVSKYQKLNSEDYIRLGLCLPDCQDCATGSPGHLKNDKMVSHSQSVSEITVTIWSDFSSETGAGLVVELLKPQIKSTNL